MTTQLLVALALSTLTSTAMASVIDPSAFVKPVVTTFDGLGLSFINDSPITIDGNSFDTTDQEVRYFAASTCNNECVSTDGDTDTMTITLGAPSQRVGLTVGASAADVHFFDLNNVEIGFISVSGDETTPVFAGWDAGKSSSIGSVQITDTEANSRVVTVDDLTVEDTPEPGTVMMLMGGLGVLAFVKKRRSAH